ncbi:MAG: hypothetical protein ACQEXJ_00030 [Myxococcota bacterium]
MKTIEHADYPIHAAGRVWVVESATLTELRDGTLGLSSAELSRIHRAIANAICGTPGKLTADELEFLCDITDTSYADVARVLDVDKSTITLWRKKGVVSKLPFSLLLKRWFWFELFGSELGDTNLPLSALATDELLLRRVQQAAIEQEMTFEVHEKKAS